MNGLKGKRRLRRKASEDAPATEDAAQAAPKGGFGRKAWVRPVRGQGPARRWPLKWWRP